MRVLYLAIDQRVPGTTGGSIHTAAVAEGLAALGHDVHAVAALADGRAASGGGVTWHRLEPPFGAKQLRWMRAGSVVTIAEAVRPDIVIERYYNFGGEGMAASTRARVPYVLEVNAPVVDYPGSIKHLIDRALVVEPMRRWRERQVRHASLVVTPASAIVPAWYPRERILEIEWGADTSRFRPGASGAMPFERPPGLVAVFAGAFRAWHGAVHLVEAIRDLRARGRRDVSAVLIGAGPELAAARRAAAGVDGIVFTGAVPHDRMPACLAACDVGVAPFDLPRHAPLAIDFFWSPLKIFEYMAAGLPTIAPDIARLRAIVSTGRDGLLYDTGRPGALAGALERLADDGALRARMGAAARARAVAEFGWDVHCRRLEEALRRCVS
jgi:glycosyltransferase involved in cell wall biosynthesis